MGGSTEGSTGPGYGFGLGFAVRLQDGFGWSAGSKGDAMWGGVHEVVALGSISQKMRPAEDRSMMNRRTLIGVVAANAVLPLLNRVAGAQTSPKTKNVVFVHGLFADGSCWSKVIVRLQQKGVNCTSVQNPLNSLHEASEAARRAIAVQPGPTALVGHSFSGMIVSDVGVDSKVSDLVYIDARAPDTRE